MTEDGISEALKRMERRAEISLKHVKEDKDSEKAEGWKRAVEHYTCAAEALKKVRQYMAIGTVEECQEAMEKQKAKKPVKDEHNHECCPSCGWIVYRDEYGGRYLPHCENCGQAIDWSRKEREDYGGT